MTVFDAVLTASTALDVMAASRGGAGAIAARQATRLARLREIAMRRSPFYRCCHHGLADAPLQALPPVQKTELMESFDDWVTDPRVHLSDLLGFLRDPQRIGDAFAGAFVVWESSGSSGEPGVFVQDARAMAVYDAVESLRRSTPRPLQRWLDPLFIGERMAFVGATGGHFATAVTVERLRRLNPWVAQSMRTFSILQPLSALTAQLEEWAPSVLATYPTAAALLAEEAQHGRLRINPDEVWTGGETLTPAMRHLIESGLACSVRNSYGASEFLPIAWECDEGLLHLNADWVILEPVDAQMRPVPPGELGSTTLLTNLANFVQPLIRYDVGDQVRFADQPCGCGSVLPAIEVHGRRDAVLQMRGAAGRQITLLPLALTTVLEEQAGLYDFQLCQRDPTTLVLRVGTHGATGAAAVQRACAAVRGFAQQQGVIDVRVFAEAGVLPARGRTGKAPRVVATPADRPAAAPAREPERTRRSHS
jgi:phenylacetate-CoA ligase